MRSPNDDGFAQIDSNYTMDDLSELSMVSIDESAVKEAALKEEARIQTGHSVVAKHNIDGYS